MITFRCTQKLLKELRLDKNELGEPDEGVFGSWFAHIFRLDRKKCVLFTNDRTLYSVLLFGLKKQDFELLDQRFVSALVANLKSEEVPSEIIASIGMACHPVSWGLTNNRSVLGSMNDMIKGSKLLFTVNRHIPPADEIQFLNHYINHTPMSTLKMVRPADEMKAALEGWSP